MTPPAASASPRVAPAATGSRARGRPAGRGPVWLWALLGYAALAALIFALPLATTPGTRIVAGNDLVPSEFMWLLKWWPYALLHGHDPVAPRSFLVPEGTNLSWATSVPGPSLLLAPVTLAFGPVVTWNVLAVAAPALSAWTAFLLCRHVTRATAPSLAGGLVFGFSSYMLGNLEGLPQLTLVALVPVIVLLVVRRLDGTLGERAFVGWAALALAGQFLISTEVLSTGLLIGAAVLLLAVGVLPHRGRDIARVAGGLVVALAGMAVLVSPLLAAAFLRAHLTPEYAVGGAQADLLSLVVPRPRTTALDFGSGTWRVAFGYLGLPLLVIVALAAWQWRRPAARVALAAFVVATVASFGSSLHVHGRDTGIPLPWAALGHLPVLRYAIPLRLAVFATLGVAVLVAGWLSAPRAAQRWALAAVAAVFLVPAVGSRAFNTRIADPTLFSTSAWRHVLGPRDRVLVVPVVGADMRWHAEADYGFALVGGGFANFPASYEREPAWLPMVLGQPTPAMAGPLRRFVRDKGVTVVVLDRAEPARWRALLATLGVRPRALGGTFVYRLRRVGPVVRHG